MRYKLLIGIVLVAAFAFWRADPTYSLTGRPWPDCVGPLDTASGCNHLRGPVHTVDMQGLVPLIYSKKGLLIEWGIRKNGVFERHRYERHDGGLTLVDKIEWTGKDQVRHEENVISLNQRGDVISKKTRVDGGTFTIYYRREFDSAGREVSTLMCSTDGKFCQNTRTESEYDAQGRLTISREIDLPSGLVVSHKDYEYPAENRRRTLEFSLSCRDPNVPASVPTYIIETTYDNARRVVGEITSAPAKIGWCEDSPQPGHIVRQYDGQGQLVDETHEAGGVRNFYGSYRYDSFGNQISTHVVQRGAGVETVYDSEFSYEYDRFGNWTSKTSYNVNSDGQRRQVGPVEHQKLTYY